MIGTPHWPWLTILLAALLFGDALVSVRPPAAVRRCLHGVRFPEDWWWTLVVVKLLATVGLIIGLKVPGVAFAANAALCVYFVCAAYAHYRARYLERDFWINCLGMLLVCSGVLVASYAL